MSGITGNNEGYGSVKDKVRYLGLRIIASAFDEGDIERLTSTGPWTRQKIGFWLDCADMSKSDLNRAIANRFPRSTRRCA